MYEKIYTLKMSKYENKLENFISTHSELVGEYESMDGMVPVEFCEEEIITIISN